MNADDPVPRWVAGNVGFACSHATRGYALGLAIACGKDTEAGRMMELSFKRRPETRVTKHLRQVNCYMLCVAVVLFVRLLFTASSTDNLIHVIIYLWLLVVLIPLYLPFILYWGMRLARDMMHDNQCYARNLEATSTLGLTTVIVTDLSRTMTKRWMRVSEVFVNMKLTSTTGADVKALGPRFIELIRASVLCNDAIVNPGNIGVPKMKKSMYGNVLDIALLKYGLIILDDIKQLREDHEKVANKTYSSADRVQVTIHRTRRANGGLLLILLMKGHSDTVIRRCSTLAVHDEEITLDEKIQDTIINLAEGLTEAGRHVRAFAYKELTSEMEMRRISQFNNGTMEGGDFRDYLAVDTFSLRFLGLIAAHNPPRSTIPKAVARCRSAGIKLILVTTQEPNMASSLALQVGLMSHPLDEMGQSRSTPTPTEVVDMSKYVDMRDNHHRWYIEQMLLHNRDLVCANAVPEQLHWIVEACKRMGAVVSVIGGSIHDAPALRNSNVGIARFGCSSLCEACADLILLDSSFATLVSAIGISRLQFENVKKALAYCLATATTTILCYIAFFALRIPLVPEVTDLLYIATFVNLIPALSLLYERPEEQLMLQKPKIYDDWLINTRLLFVSLVLVGFVEAAAVFLTYFMFMADRGFMPGTLVGLNLDWHDASISDVLDSYGEEWSRVERDQLNCQVSTLLQMTLIMMQCTHLVLCKTTRTNVLVQGFHNVRQRLAMVYLIALCILLWWLDSVFCLHLEGALQLDFSLFLWTILPFVPLLLFLESARRYFLRRFPNSWLERATMF